ncbi:MAG: kinase [Synechococcus sp. TMED90]|nr:MAG: kinase [Synechococcus sp. TMED90]
MARNSRPDAPLGGHALLELLGWPDPECWWRHWQARGGLSLVRDHWAVPVDDAWIASLALPLLTRVEQAHAENAPTLLGVSALPGCGKTTLCSWIKHAADHLGWSVEHLSIDDFYWPADELERSMAGNPWGVPRALPGSHDLIGMERCLQTWLQGDCLEAPRFDKSLRGGRGDRCGSTISKPRVVLLEGWFLGAVVREHNDEAMQQQLTPSERQWRPKALRKLREYATIWSMLDELWHLRIENVDASARWKRQQLNTLLESTGVNFVENELSDFNRMVQVALPSRCLDCIPGATIIVDLTSERAVREVRFS